MKKEIYVGIPLVLVIIGVIGILISLSLFSNIFHNSSYLVLILLFVIYTIIGGSSFIERMKK